MSSYNRRDFFSRLIRGRDSSQPRSDTPVPPPSPAKADPGTLLAVIAARHCLAYQGQHCDECYKVCPEPGAIVMEASFPKVELSKCTGCQLCHEACPAPVNAIFMTARRPTA